MFWILKSSDKRMEYIEKHLNKMGILTNTESENIVLPIHYDLKDGFFNETEINLKDLLKKGKIKKILAGLISDELKELTKNYNVEVISYLDDEELTIKNSYLTMEGLLYFFYKQEICVFDESFLVLGYGYTGQVIAKALKDLKGDVSIYAKDYHDRKNMILNGYKFHDLSSFEDDLIIINTIPHVIFDKKLIEKLSKNAIFIDIASAPGGIDFEYAKEFGIKTFKLLGIPGKIFPKKAGEIIAESLKKMVK